MQAIGVSTLCGWILVNCGLKRYDVLHHAGGRNDTLARHAVCHARAHAAVLTYPLFTAAQLLRRWFSALTQTVTQTPKNQVELSVPERIFS